MAWYSMADANGRGGWAFNPDGAAHLIRSNHYNRELMQRSRIVRRDHGWLMPTTTEVETNFTGIREAVNRVSRATVDQLDRDFTRNPRGLYEWLVRVREDGETTGEAYRRLSQTATRETTQAIGTNVNRWENALAATKFVRDTSAGVLFVGATVLSGGAAAAVGAAGAGLTFTGATQDNLAANQTMRQAMGRAAISTSIAVVTNVLIPRGLGAVGQGMLPAAIAGQAAPRLTAGQNIALGLIGVQANVAGDIIKTALTADSAAGPVSQQAAAQAQQQLRRQVGARAGFEVIAMAFQAVLAARGIPASPFLLNHEDAVNSVTGGVLSAVGDRIVTAISEQNNQANNSAVGRARPGDMDIVLSRLQRVMNAEAYVREVAMVPL